ncbi:hypothetical protein H0H93_009552 [Arthromyces matolae]|nr:hypothetical protein H0H93_009552 [Arthromyces matolae]
MLTVKQLSLGIFVAVWDISLTFINLVTPKRKIGKVTQPGCAGEGGKWPEFIPAKDGDSRCSCPALNAMANHGILPRDGKNISFKEMNRLINDTYNFSPSFCYFVPKYAANMLNKNYDTDTFNLAELDLHNGIEHDGSLVRRDLHFEPNQAVIHVPYVKELLESASGKDSNGNTVLTIADMSRMLSKRRAESRAENPEFSLDKIHKSFSSSNGSTMLTIFGGRVQDLETVLLEERLPDGWESRIRETKGLTLLTFNSKTVSKVEKGVDESKFASQAKEPEEPTSPNSTTKTNAEQDTS